MTTLPAPPRSRSRTLSVAALWCGLCTGLLHATEVTVLTVAGESRTGDLVVIRGRTVRLRQGSEDVFVKLQEVRRLQFAGNAETEFAAAPIRLTLFSFDEIGATGIELQEDVLTVESPVFGTATLPIDSVRRMTFSTETGRQPPVEEAKLSSQDADVVLLENGDLIRGSIVRITAGELTMETTLGAVNVARNRIRDIAMNEELLSSWERGLSMYSIIELANGEWLTVVDFKAGPDGSLQTTLVVGTELSMPLNAIARISQYGQGVESLADREPVESSGAGFFGQEVHPATNRNQRGGSLNVNGRSFRRGIGMTSRTTLSFDVQEGDRAFQSQFGMDDDAPPVAGVETGVVMRVILDGRIGWESGVVRPGDGLRETPVIPLTGLNRLSLEVDFGPGADIQDLANWCDPVILRE